MKFNYRFFFGQGEVRNAYDKVKQTNETVWVILRILVPGYMLPRAETGAEFGGDQCFACLQEPMKVQ